MKVDITDLTRDNLEIDRCNRLPRKLLPNKALEALGKDSNITPLYKAVYDIYLHKLNGIIGI